MAATHEDLSREFEVEGSSDRTLGLVFAGFFALLTFWPLVHHRPVRIRAGFVSIAFLLTAVARPQLLSPLNKFWTKLGLLLQKVIHPLVMGIMFYAIFTPAGLLIRWLGNDLLHLKYEPDSNSYWIARVPPGPDGASMARQF